LIGEVEKLKTSSAAQEEREHRLHTLLEQVSIQSQEMAEKDQKIKDQEKQINRLQRMLNAASQGSPSSPIRADQVDVRAGGKRPPPPINLKEDFVPPAQKKTKSASTTTTALRLDGVQNTATEDKVGGITVSNELERMWKEGYLSKMREDLEGEETLSKEVLFMRQYTDLYGHPAFKKGGEMAKYDKGMSFVAIAITDDDWGELCAGKLDDEKSRNLFSRVQKDTMTTACEMEKQFLEDGKAKEKSKPTIHSLGTRLSACEKDRKKSVKSFVMSEYVMEKATGKRNKNALTSYFAPTKK
jgi:hypothetical protein